MKAFITVFALLGLLFVTGTYATGCLNSWGWSECGPPPASHPDCGVLGSTHIPATARCNLGYTQCIKDQIASKNTQQQLCQINSGIQAAQGGKILAVSGNTAAPCGGDWASFSCTTDVSPISIGGANCVQTSVQITGSCTNQGNGNDVCSTTTSVGSATVVTTCTITDTTINGGGGAICQNTLSIAPSTSGGRKLL